MIVAMISLMFMALLVAASPTDPVEAAYSSEFNRCLETDDAAKGVTAAMVACTLNERARQDVLLNRTYRAAMARRSASDRASLRRDERAWIARRDATCSKAYEETGGTIDRILGATCLLHETTERRLWLERRAP